MSVRLRVFQSTQTERELFKTVMFFFERSTMDVFNTVILFKWLREDFFRESSFRMDHKVFIMVLLFSTDQGILHWKQLPASFFSSLPINENTVESVVCIWFTLTCLLLSVHQWVNADPKWNEKGTFWEKSLVLVMASKIVKHSPSGYFFEFFFQLQTW